MDLKITLEYSRPNTAWTLLGNSYKDLEWLDATTKPTEEELEAAWPAANYWNEYNKVSLARQAAYSAPGGSDGMFFQFQRGAKTEQEWLDAVAVIDAANPYPKAPKGVKL